MAGCWQENAHRPWINRLLEQQREYLPLCGINARLKTQRKKRERVHAGKKMRQETGCVIRESKATITKFSLDDGEEARKEIRDEKNEKQSVSHPENHFTGSHWVSLQHHIDSITSSDWRNRSLGQTEAPGWGAEGASGFCWRHSVVLSLSSLFDISVRHQKCSDSVTPQFMKKPKIWFILKGIICRNVSEKKPDQF